MDYQYKIWYDNINTDIEQLHRNFSKLQENSPEKGRIRMAQFFKAFGRTITIDDEFMDLIEKNMSFLNDVACEHYLSVRFGKNIEEELGKYTDEELSEIVKERAKSEVVAWG